MLFILIIITTIIIILIIIIITEHFTGDKDKRKIRMVVEQECLLDTFEYRHMQHKLLLSSLPVN